MHIPTRTPKHPVRWSVLCLAACIGAAFTPVIQGTRRADAQVVDPGKQRIDLLKEARRTNELLIEIRDLLKRSDAKAEEGG